MKNKNLLLILAALALAAGAAYVWYARGKKASGPAMNQVFAVADTARIDSIILTSRMKGRHTAARRADGWVLDGGEQIAPAIVQQLLMTIGEIKVKRPCTRAEREIVIKQMATENTRVDVYRQGEHAITYFISNASTDEGQGSYGLLEGSEEPVVLHVANWQGFVGARFVVDGLNWRNKRLFASTPAALERVQIAFPARPADDVELVLNGRNFSMTGVERMDTSRVVALAMAFNAIFIEDYFDNVRIRDSLKQALPYAIVTVKDKSPARSHELRLYQPPLTGRLTLDSLDRMPGLVADKNWYVTLQPQNYLQLLRPRSFYAKPGA